MSDLSLPNTSSSTENTLTSESYADILEVLELLYLQGNISARVRLIKDWPVLADYLLGAELIGFDMDGTDDLERRAALEEEAEIRRFELLGVVKNIESSSAKAGVFQHEYVEPLVKSWGRDLAALIYADRIVDKILGPSITLAAAPLPKPAPVEEIDVLGDVSAQYAPNPQDVKDAPVVLPTPGEMKFSTKLVGPSADGMDDVKPIDAPASADFLPLDAPAMPPPIVEQQKAPDALMHSAEKPARPIAMPRASAEETPPTEGGDS